MADERDFDDFDTQVQSDEAPEADAPSESEMEQMYAGYDNDIDSGRWDDDPSPYDGTYSEE